MKNLSDYQIFQRNSEGFAEISVSGELKAPIPADCHISARVVKEDDNITIVYWTPCALIDGKYSVTLNVPEGGLYRIEVGIENNDPHCPRPLVKLIHHIGVGDIFIAAGQSNMSGYGTDNAYDPPELGVHALTNTGKWDLASHPLASGVDSIFGLEEFACATSPALSFARNLKRYIGVPVGIIPAALGGSPLSLWDPTAAGDCYRAMKKRMEYFNGFRGFVWFQGCSDAGMNEAPSYYDRFCNMKKLYDEEFGPHPFLTVQLNRLGWSQTLEEDRGWGIIRDAQRRLSLDLPDVYVVPSIDLPVSDEIHNSAGANVIIGERLANTAAKKLYGLSGQTAPSVISAEYIDETHIRVKITEGHRVQAMGNRGFGMNIEDADGICECVSAVPENNALIITSARKFTLPAEFHYGWHCRPTQFVARDQYGMPLTSCYGVKING